MITRLIARVVQWPILWAALISLGFTLLMLRWSFDHFRLAYAPFVDDVNWLNTGIGMLHSLRDGGLSGFMHYVVETRTLQPYSIVAAVGFALFGIVDWAPYLMNGWLIFSLLVFLEILRRRQGLPLRTWFLSSALALSFPICGFAVTSFLGDLASGLFLAMGAIAFVQGWPDSESPLESWAGTFAWIFAFYGKATLSPETALLFCLSAVAGCGFSLREEARSRSAVLRGWSARILVVPLAVLPYYAIIAQQLYAYLYLNNYGALRQVWAFQGGLGESLLYYLTGFSGGKMLGPGLYVALALLLLRLAVPVRSGTSEKQRFATLMMILTITYAMPTSMTSKTATVASPFDFLLILTTILSLYALLKAFPQPTWAMALLAAATLLGIFRYPEPLDARNSPAVAARHRTMEGIVNALTEQGVKRDEPVFLTTVGYVGVNSLIYQFEKRHLPMPHFFDQVLSDDLSLYPSMIDMATFVLATEPGNEEVIYTVPSAFVQVKTLAMVQEDPRFVEVARFRTWRGKHYYLFGRRDRVKVPAATSAGDPEDEGSIPGPVLASGFYPSGAAGSGKSNSRWTGREFEIDFPAPRGLYAELKLRFSLPQTSLDKLGPVTMRADIEREGSHSETITQAGPHEFTYRYTIREHLVATVPIRFRVDKALPAPDGRGNELGVLFESVQLEPVATALRAKRGE